MVLTFQILLIVVIFISIMGLIADKDKNLRISLMVVAIFSMAAFIYVTQFLT